MRAAALCASGLAWAAAVQAANTGTFLEPKGPLTFPVAKSSNKATQVDVDKQVEAFVDKRYEANLAELGSYASTADSQAAAAAEEAKLAEQHVQQLDLQNQVLLANAEDYNKQAAARVAEAEASNEQLDKTFAAAEEFAKGANAIAQQNAVKAVEDMFANKYKELEGWRQEVLTDHWENARRAGMEASEPYEYAEAVATERSHAYKAASEQLTAVAKGLSDQANKASLTAGMKRMNGDVDAADVLAKVAKGMRSHGQEVNVYAKDLQAESAALSEEAPKFLERGLAAARRARYDANPGYLPPLPMNPNFDFAPPR
eukprot:gb/GFBE01002937.1/.p1 GENE.gb/GFBE01002937.1/~~gb/GFBE01002937.1/.p1  ORF type:complete len:315 (+),score=112.57 gb/GFBE01002937.1/:1-945(+)